MLRGKYYTVTRKVRYLCAVQGHGNAVINMTRISCKICTVDNVIIVHLENICQAVRHLES